MAEDDEIGPAGEKEKEPEEGDSSSDSNNAVSDSSDSEDDLKEEKDEIDKIGNKKRDAWEKENAYKRRARKSSYLAVVNSNDEKDKNIKEQAKGIHLPLIEAEETIAFLKGLEPKDKKERKKLVRRLEGMRRSRQKLHERLHELCVAQKYGWKVVTRFQQDRLTGEEKEVQRAVEKVRRRDEADHKRSGGPSSKRSRDSRDSRDARGATSRQHHNSGYAGGGFNAGPFGSGYGGFGGGAHSGYGGQWGGPPYNPGPQWPQSQHHPAAAAGASGSQPPPPGTGPPRVCFQCRKEGHLARFCPERK